MKELKGLKHRRLSQTVIEEIYKMIDGQEMKPGEKFPTDSTLVELWNVSRNVLREAFYILETQGIVISRQGKGRFLRNIPDEPDVQDNTTSKLVARYSLLDLYEVRQGLEMKVMDLVVKKATDEEISRLEKDYNDMCTNFYKQNNTMGENSLHKYYAVLSHNDYLMHLVNELVDSTNLLMKQLFFYMARMHSIEKYITDHGIILEAIKQRDSERAQKAMSDHLQETIEIIITK